MAAKRDHRAERQRRNELARQRGYSSRDVQTRRRRLGQVSPLDPAPVRPPILGPSKQGFVAARKREEAGFASLEEVRELRKQVKAWSDRHAHSAVMRVDPKLSRNPDYIRTYYNVWMNKETGFHKLSDPRSRVILRHYFVDLLEYMDDAEFERRYGPL